MKLDLGVPDGPIAYKYTDFRDNWDFIGNLFISPYAGAKSTAMVDAIAKSGIEYPGCNLLLCGHTLSDLKKSTIPKLTQRVGIMFDSENNNEAVYRFPVAPDPLTGNPTQSIIRCLGVDRTNIEDVMKSTEWFRVFIEEANTVPSDAHDVVLARARQFAFHRSFTVHQLMAESSRLWGVTPEEAYEIMRQAEGHPVHQYKLEPDSAMPGRNGVKCVMNPHGNDHVWMRYTGVPFPDDGVTRDWAKDNIGVRNYYFSKPDRDEVQAPLVVGNMVCDKDDNYAYIRTIDGQKITLMDGTVKDSDDLDLVLQMYTIYGFPDENKSRNYANHQAALLMQNRSLRRKAFAGVVDNRIGLVFPNFIPRPVSEGGHIMRYPEKGLPTGLTGIGGVDQGGGHATAAVMALLTRESRAAIIFREYVKSGVSASTTAYELASAVPAGMQMRWAGDPAMWAKTYDQNATTSRAQHYIDALSWFEQGRKGDEAFDNCVELLEYKDSFQMGKRQAKLYVFDNCPMTIEAMSTLTWNDVRHGRHKWVVDLGDAIKLMCSLIDRAATEDDIPLPTGRSPLPGAFVR